MKDLHIGAMQVIADEMMVQNHRGTQYPMYFIQLKVREYGDKWDCSNQERNMEADDEEMCSTCQEKYNNDEELSDKCDECSDRAFYYYRERWQDCVDVGGFFTENQAQAHIDANYYHYQDPQIYVHTCWRNPEMQATMRMILEFRTDKEKPIPSHYL